MKKAPLAIVLGIVVTLAGCSAGGKSAPAAGGASSNTTLRIAYQGDIASFDPDNNFEVAGLGAILAVYQGLVAYAPGTTKIEGLLAKSWKVSPDGRTYDFTLRDGVKFGSGKPMTSAEVKASFERRMSPKLGLSYFLADVASMRTPSPTEFVLTLKHPAPGLLDSFSSAWGPKVVGPDALISHAGADQSATWLNEHADGTGPFLLTSFVRGQGYKLERNPNYWGPKPMMSTVDIKIVPDVGQQVLQLRNGDLDMVLHGYPFPQLKALPAGLKKESYNDLGLELAFINPHRHLTTTAMRRRVQAGLNPSGWVQEAFGDNAAPAKSLFPSAMLTPARPYTWPSAGETQSTNVPPIEIAYAAEEAGVQQRVADLLIAQLSSAGITATARAVPGVQAANFPKHLSTAPDIYLAQNNPDSADPGSQVGLFYTTGGGLNIFSYSNPAADKIFARAAATIDTTQRNALFDAGARLIFDDAGFLPLAEIKDVIVYRGSMSGFGTKPAIPWNVDLGTITRTS